MAGKDTFRGEFIEAGFEFVEEVDLGELDSSSYALHYRLP